MFQSLESRTAAVSKKRGRLLRCFVFQLSQKIYLHVLYDPNITGKVRGDTPFKSTHRHNSAPTPSRNSSLRILLPPQTGPLRSSRFMNNRSCPQRFPRFRRFTTGVGNSARGTLGNRRKKSLANENWEARMVFGVF